MTFPSSFESCTTADGSTVLQLRMLTASPHGTLECSPKRQPLEVAKPHFPAAQAQMAPAAQRRPERNLAHIHPPLCLSFHRGAKKPTPKDSHLGQSSHLSS